MPLDLGVRVGIMESNDLSALEGRMYYDDFGASHHSSGYCLDG